MVSVLVEWIIGIAIVAALFIFEPSREFLLEHLDDMVSDLSELPSQFVENFANMFTNLSEFSPMGLLFGVGMEVILFMSKDNLYEAFKGFSGTFLWLGVIYVAGFVIAYLIGRNALE